MLLIGRIRTHDPERALGRELLVPCTRWQHDHIPGPRRHDDAIVATELDRHFTAVDAKRFVRVAVEVVERIDAVAPG